MIPFNYMINIVCPYGSPTSTESSNLLEEVFFFRVIFKIVTMFAHKIFLVQILQPTRDFPIIIMAISEPVSRIKKRESDAKDYGANCSFYFFQHIQLKINT